MKPETIKAVVMLAVAAALFGAGWAVEGWRMGAEIARIKKTQADAQRDAAQENAKTLAVAAARGDQLLLVLAGWKATLTKFAEEKNHEIERLATGRRCLDSALVRVLNRPAGVELSGPVPEATGGTVRADAAPESDPDDGRFATDGDVSKWATQCRLRYDTCRLDRDAIGQFYAGDSRVSE